MSIGMLHASLKGKLLCESYLGGAKLNTSVGYRQAKRRGLPGIEVRRLLSAMRRCSFRRLPTSADRLESLFPETRSSLKLVNAPIPTPQCYNPQYKAFVCRSLDCSPPASCCT